MRILLCNDDGVHARGLKALYKVFRRYGKVIVAAPLEEKSTTGHSLTLHKPLRVREIEKDFYGISGSPADCVNIGVKEIFGQKPDLVISGINRGANLGQDVYYSGTVSGAREACFMGIPSMAVSLALEFNKRINEDNIHYEAAAKMALKVIKWFEKKDLPKYTLLNLNVPDCPLDKVKGVHLTRQGFRYYSGSILKRKDHRGNPYFWVGGQYKGFKNEEGTDCHSIEQGYASLTPLKLDTTHLQYMNQLTEEWPF